jgi:hypothetical protein
MEDAGNFGEIFAIACQNWTWLSAAMMLGVVVGWATCRGTPAG